MQQSWRASVVKTCSMISYHHEVSLHYGNRLWVGVTWKARRQAKRHFYVALTNWATWGFPHDRTRTGDIRHDRRSKSHLRHLLLLYHIFKELNSSNWVQNYNTATQCFCVVKKKIKKRFITELSHSFLSRIIEPEVGGQRELKIDVQSESQSQLKNQRSTYEVEVNFLYDGIYGNLRRNGKPFPNSIASGSCRLRQ